MVSAQSGGDAGPIKASPAYAEVLLRKTELLADLESLLPDYTEASPRVTDLRAELGQIDRSLQRMFAIRPSETGKLTLALGKLIVRHAALQTELSRLMRSYTKEQSDVKRASRKAAVFESAINDLLK